MQCFYFRYNFIVILYHIKLKLWTFCNQKRKLFYLGILRTESSVCCRVLLAARWWNTVLISMHSVTVIYQGHAGLQLSTKQTLSLLSWNMQSRFSTDLKQIGLISWRYCLEWRKGEISGGDENLLYLWGVVTQVFHEFKCLYCIIHVIQKFQTIKVCPCVNISCFLSRLKKGVGDHSGEKRK
jgi:hypothetical protein